ncbi:MAG: hypothetical protein N3A57_05415 [Negativicutes bacterium]|nr:hypothetical protein [Negativicutes bacterium]
MRIASKINLTVFILLSVMAAVVIGGGYKLADLLVDRQIERFAVTQMDGAEAQLRKNERFLLDAVHDWAWWNDTYNFISTRNPEYRRDTMNYPTLITLQVNAAVYTDQGGAVVLARGADLRERTPVPVADAVLRELFGAGSRLTVAGGNSLVGLLRSKEHSIILLASDQIRHTGGEPPGNGRLCFMRYIDDTNRLNLDTGDAAVNNLYTVDDPAIPEEVRQKLRDGRRTVLGRNDSGRLDVYRLLDDAYGSPEFVLHSRVDISQFVLPGWLLLAAAGLTAAMVVGLWLVFAGYHWLHIGRRWQALEDFVQALLYTRNYNQRIQVRGHDDLADVSETLNDVLNAIHRRHVRLQQELNDRDCVIAELQSVVEGKIQVVSSEARRERQQSGADGQPSPSGPPPAPAAPPPDFAAVLAAARALNTELNADRNALLE